uniref:Uncharacterized protein n=1 Tax=Pectinophora gossypiella TaxID=13191 RepID=A0A1E1WG43_PECGO
MTHRSWQSGVGNAEYSIPQRNFFFWGTSTPTIKSVCTRSRRPTMLTKADKEVQAFALSLSFSQLVNCAARVPDVANHTANCLDLLPTTDPDRYQVSVTFL